MKKNGMCWLDTERERGGGGGGWKRERKDVKFSDRLYTPPYSRPPQGKFSDRVSLGECGKHMRLCIGLLETEGATEAGWRP